MSLLDIDALRDTLLETDPFDYCIVPNFVRPDVLRRLDGDFPVIEKGGSFPLSSLNCGPLFRGMTDELSGTDMQRAIEKKFDIDLEGRPTTITVRGRTRQKDGRIHTDSKTKLITVLLYLNNTWDNEGGRLRLLRSGDDIDDYAAEVEPANGVLVVFRCTDKAFHGHLPYVGQRRSLQLNWVTDDAAARGVSRRHQVSAFLKKLNPFRAS